MNNNFILIYMKMKGGKYYSVSPDCFSFHTNDFMSFYSLFEGLIIHSIITQFSLKR